MVWMMPTNISGSSSVLAAKLEKAKEAIEDGLQFSDVATKFQLTRAVVWQLAMGEQVNACVKCEAGGTFEGKVCGVCNGAGLR